MKAMSGSLLPDGLDALRAEIALAEVMRLIERTARWADPETFRILPLWYPEHARRAPSYKKNWSEPQMNRNKQTGHVEHKREANIYASKALTYALGLRSEHRSNWSCCHIWGVDDALYQESNVVVQDRKYYSCVANMVLLPTPLKAFTDAMLEVKMMLRVCANSLYGWNCDHESVKPVVAKVAEWADWDGYPGSWPTPSKPSTPMGVVKLDSGIRQSATRRLDQIRHDLEKAGPHYPRDDVRAALSFWKIPI